MIWFSQSPLDWIHDSNDDLRPGIDRLRPLRRQGDVKVVGALVKDQGAAAVGGHAAQVPPQAPGEVVGEVLRLAQFAQSQLSLKISWKNFLFVQEWKSIEVIVREKSLLVSRLDLSFQVGYP